MEDGSLPEDCDISVGEANVELTQSECICTQPTTSGDTDEDEDGGTHTFPLHQPPSPGNNLYPKTPAPFGNNPAPFSLDPSQIKEAAGDDLCLRCVLSCLYCELVSICATLEACLTCPGGGAICCCCCEASGCCCSVEAEGVACCDEACEALMDCTIVEDCCSSTDLLDFCLECCSFFFPS